MKKGHSQKLSTVVGNLLLVNRANPCCRELRPEQLAPVGPGSDGVRMERQAAALLDRLVGDLHGWGQVAAISGWRSGEEQRQLWENSNRANGEAFTHQYVAPPGCSEHLTGLAVDLGLRRGNMDPICPDFPDMGICRAIRMAAPRYGFILRYPRGKEHITGIAWEPWHFRYVGIPHAEIITLLDATLEEYLELLRQYPAGQREFRFRAENYAFRVSYLPDAADDARLPDAPYLVSGDNCGGRILTTWDDGEVKYAHQRNNY